MADRLRKLYHWSRDGLGSTIVALSWVLLWLLWPTGRPALPPKRPSRPAAISYVREPVSDARFRVMPDQFARAQLAVFGIADRIEGMMSEAPEPVLPAPDFLERTPEDAAHGPYGGEDLLAARIESTPSRYGYDAGDGPVFGPAGAPTSGIRVALSPELASSGLTLPSPADLSGKGQKPWMVRAYVEVHPRGWVEHVMLETPCEAAGVNAMLIRYLQKGKTARTGRCLSGRVTVTFVP